VLAKFHLSGSCMPITVVMSLPQPISESRRTRFLGQGIWFLVGSAYLEILLDKRRFIYFGRPDIWCLWFSTSQCTSHFAYLATFANTYWQDIRHSGTTGQVTCTDFVHVSTGFLSALFSLWPVNRAPKRRLVQNGIMVVMLMNQFLFALQGSTPSC